MKYCRIIVAIALLMNSAAAQPRQASANTYDLVVYGGTAAVVTVAGQAKRVGAPDPARAALYVLMARRQQV
jgi:hypothetical protein